MSLKRTRLASPHCRHNVPWQGVTFSANGEWRYGICTRCNLQAAERIRLPEADPPPPAASAQTPPATEEDSRQWRYQG
jgi:hypothetical protein